MGISRRIPGWGQIAPVYSMIVLVLYGWTIMWFFWKLPSWLYFLETGEILSVLAYALAVNFAESIAALCLPVALALLLPRKWFYDAFVARGVSLVLAGAAGLMYAAYQFTSRDEVPNVLSPAAVILILLLIALAVYLAGRLPAIARALAGLADRATIFLYGSVPLSVVAVFVVALRQLR